MKREIILVVFLLMLLTPLISASQIELNKQSFDQGETLFARISGNFVDQVTEEDIHFYRNHLEIPVYEYNVEKIGEDFYLYASLRGLKENNYSLRIEGVRYYQATSIVDETIRENFTISNANASFSITPGFIETNESFSVELQNLVNERTTINVASDSGIETETNTLELNIGEIRDFNIYLESPESKEEITFTSESGTEYVFTLFVPSSTTDPNQDQETEEKDFEFEVSSLDITMSTNSESKRVIYLKNTGETDIQNIELAVSESMEPYIEIKPSEINELEYNESMKIEILITSDEEEINVNGIIIASTTGNENLLTSSAITLEFIPDFVPSNETETGGPSKICAEVGGEICGDSEICGGDIYYAQDGTCCLGICEQESVGFGSTGRWIGWGLVALVVLLVYWFFKSKYKKAGTKKDGLLSFLRKNK